MATFQRTTIFTAAVLAVLIGSFIQPPEAGACTPCFWQGDGKIIPGSACTVRYGSVSTSYWIDWRSSICNYDSNANLKVTCPVVRDNTTNTDGLNCAEAYFYWDGFTDEAYCVLYSRQASGHGNYYSTDHTGPAAVGSTFIGLHINYSYNRGYYNMTCLIPPEAPGATYSCLRSFQWAE